jgi:hypothetical protein
MPHPIALTSADAITMLGVSRRTLSRMIATGKIKPGDTAARGS